jgi:hypothetical protein
MIRKKPAPHLMRGGYRFSDKIFGKYDQCFVPDADMRARVME